MTDALPSSANREIQEVRDFVEMIEHALTLNDFQRIATTAAYVRGLVDKLFLHNDE